MSYSHTPTACHTHPCSQTPLVAVGTVPLYCVYTTLTIVSPYYIQVPIQCCHSYSTSITGNMDSSCYMDIHFSLVEKVISTVNVEDFMLFVYQLL